MVCCCSVTCLVVLIVVYFVARKIISRLRIARYTDVYVLITGCDSGFGNESAKRFDRIGCHVFAACFTDKGRESLQQECSDRLHAIKLEVTKKESIQEAYEYVKAHLPKGQGLWGVINNAGISGKYGPNEWLSLKDYHEVLDVNLYGVINVTMTFLPLVKKARGRIVNTSSMFGRFSMPLYLHYNLSKCGVEAFTDGLRRSMRQWGVKVTVVEPGVHKTPMASVQNYRKCFTAAWDEAPPEAKEEFGKQYLDDVIAYAWRLVQFLETKTITGVLDAYEEGILGRYPRARISIGHDFHFIFVPLMLVPEWLGDWVITRLKNPPKPRVLH